jgi:CDP-diacylglycerol---serine O-phosphatidyltransferase
VLAYLERERPNLGNPMQRVIQYGKIRADGCCHPNAGRRPPSAAHEQRDVHSAVALHRGKYGGRFLRHSRSRSRDAATFWHLDNAAKAIGFAVLFDGLDGRVARMTGTSSDFGKELDSLADVITFGVAPGAAGLDVGISLDARGAGAHRVEHQAHSAGSDCCILFLIAGASRLARFNITTNPQPSNPGRPGKKYFVGMPIPAGAGVIAAVVHFREGAH